MPEGKAVSGSALRDSASTTMQPATYGEKAVGLSFNPSQDPQVAAIKGAYAAIIDQLHDLKNIAQDGETARLFSIAITEAQGAQMWAVKAVTWK